MSYIVGEAPDGPPADNKPKKPQDAINEFWEGLISQTPGKVTSIFPRSLYKDLIPPATRKGAHSGNNAAASYEAAAAECKAKVQRVVKECHRTNEKFTDPAFDIERNWPFCLRGLLYPSGQGGSDSSISSSSLREALDTLIDGEILAPASALPINLVALRDALEESSYSGGGWPRSVHRLDYIFNEPSFVLDGYSTSDVRQGANGDCWWIAAVTTLCCMPGLLDKVCVARDEECGVYGFVFYRDGEWISTIIDDNLYLSRPDFSAGTDIYDPTGKLERKYKKENQTGSEALYFASCSDPNETWLPLLEKAFAKAHGDYDAIAGGYPGEAVEDMTGGVTTTLITNKILSKEKLWQQLLAVNKDFLFAACSPGSSDSDERQGLALCHAYSILRAVEEVGEDGKKVRLVLIRNPWGRRSYNGMGEWSGPWSDGAREWTPYWLNKLDYRFGDDGEFWMSYADLLRRFDMINRTRLFHDDWTVVQEWTHVNVPWIAGYLSTKFVVEIKKAGPVVIVLSQLDSRYFKGLEGQYEFSLHFLVQEQNAKPSDYIVRARGLAWGGERSVSAETELEPGTYEVLLKISATREKDEDTVDTVVKKKAEANPAKLKQIGMNYDIAHAKGGFEEEEEEVTKKQEKDEAQKKSEEKSSTTDKAGESSEEQKEKGLKKQEEAAKKTDKAEPDSASAKEDAKSDEPKNEKPESEQSERVMTPTTDDEDAKPKDELETGETKPDAVAGGKKDDTKSEDDEGGPPKEEPTAPSAEPKTSTSGDADAKSVVADAAPQPAANPKPEPSPDAWNAVAVIGLRLYSKDPELTIKLVKGSAEEKTVVDKDSI